MATTSEINATETEAVQLWRKSYEGEVFGEAYFAVMAKNTPDSERKAKLEALEVLERCTKELLVPSMERLGISTEVNQAILDGVAAITDFDYQRMLEVTPVLAADYLRSYARLRQLVDEEDAPVINLLIAHELALELFARREATGETAISLEPVTALPHVTI